MNQGKGATAMKARFEVSTEGMRELQSGREPWQLAKELVANAWDESTTLCEVALKNTAPRKARLTVYDDGTGFAKIEDAWTLMGHTPKRANPIVRGRFNIGEKEILSVAVKATIRTSGKAISFPKNGGRLIRNDLGATKGTLVECIVPWGNRQVDETIAKLKTLLTPKGIAYTVNGEAVPYREPELVIEAILDTVLQEGGLGQPMRMTRRKTTLELYPAGKGMLYEMGIPVQPIECPFWVNIMQKVPMPPNRDVVRDSYLQDIYTAVLNATADKLTEESVSDTWVRQGVEDKEASPEAVKVVMTKRYGAKVMLFSTDTRANERALEAGYEVIHGGTLSPTERQAFQSVGLEHTSDRFGSTFANADIIPESEWTDGMREVANYAKRIAKELIGRNIGVQMYRLPRGEAMATWSMGVMGFNVSKTGKAWFDKIGYWTTATILHELAHTNGLGHNWEFQRQFETLAGRAVHLALDKPEIFKKEL
jgi:hypothetical protein